MLLIIYIIVHIVLGILSHNCFSKNNNEYHRQRLEIFSICFAPMAFIAALIMYPSYFFGWMIPSKKQKPKEVVPWTYEWYLWGELVLVDWYKKGIVVWQYWYGCLEIIYINSKTTDTVDINRVTSTTKSSELAEELAMYDQANKLLEKADAIVKEAGEIKMKAVKKRTNLIYLPK